MAKVASVCTIAQDRVLVVLVDGSVFVGVQMTHVPGEFTWMPQPPVPRTDAARRPTNDE